MSIQIDPEKCIGCGKCTRICPGDLIQFCENHKAYNAYPKECWGCASCIKECPSGAIQFYLGADIGGRGYRLYVKSYQDILDWVMESPNGEITTIAVNKKASNKY